MGKLGKFKKSLTKEMLISVLDNNYTIFYKCKYYNKFRKSAYKIAKKHAGVALSDSADIWF